eukprot:12667484-Alexandrium_andersonii.AAC.1
MGSAGACWALMLPPRGAGLHVRTPAPRGRNEDWQDTDSEDVVGRRVRFPRRSLIRMPLE